MKIRLIDFKFKVKIIFEQSLWSVIVLKHNIKLPKDT